MGFVIIHPTNLGGGEGVAVLCGRDEGIEEEVLGMHLPCLVLLLGRTGDKREGGRGIKGRGEGRESDKREERGEEGGKGRDIYARLVEGVLKSSSLHSDHTKVHTQ